jgi:hypothetical protein
VLKKLKPENGRDDLADLLHCAAVLARKDTLHYLLEIGANPNDKANGGSSALASAMWNLNFGPINSFSSKCLRSKYDVYKALDCIRELVEHGASWTPDEPGQLNSMRRILLGCESSVTAELLRLFHKHSACDPQTVEDLLRTPRMKQHLSSESWHLSRIGLKQHDSPTSKPESPPPALLKRYDRADLYEKVWSEPTRTVAKHYGVSDVWLAKVCKALRVPVPRRGYWAKKNAGKPVRRRPPLRSIAK